LAKSFQKRKSDFFAKSDFFEIQKLKTKKNNNREVVVRSVRSGDPPPATQSLGWLRPH